MTELVLTATPAADDPRVVSGLPRQAPTLLNDARRSQLRDEIVALLRARDAVLVAHYYTDGAIQDLAEQTGGCVSDSLEMARFGRDHPAATLIVAGVRFMGETAKILSPEKRVLMPTLAATCSLDLGCPINEFAAFCDDHPDRTVVVYANTSAAVKARAHWVVTSSIAVDLIEHLSARGERIIWAPDRHLGAYLRNKTGADMLLWNGACIVHEEFKARGLAQMKALYPDAAVLVHPESPAQVIDEAASSGSREHRPPAGEDLLAEAGNFVGERPQCAEQVVTQCAARLALPACLSRQRADCVPQPGEPELLEHQPVRRRCILGRPATHGCHLDDVERRVQPAPRSGPLRQLGWQPCLDEALRRGTDVAQHAACDHIVEVVGERRRAGRERRHGRREVERRAALAKDPQRTPIDEPA